MFSWIKTTVRSVIRKARRNRAAAAGGLLASAIVSLFVSYHLVYLELRHTSEVKIIGSFFEKRGPLTPPSNVLLINIDTDTFTALKETFARALPRRHLATALEKIVLGGPKLGILDLRFNFDEIDPEANQRILRALKAGPFTVASGETALGSMVDVHKDPERNIKVLTPDPRYSEASRLALSMWLAKNAEGVVTQISTSLDMNDPRSLRLPLGLALEKVAGVPVEDPQIWDMINYYGPPGTISHVSLSEIILGSQERVTELVKDRFVLIGINTMEIQDSPLTVKDVFQTPWDGKQMFGVEIHAHVLGNLLERSWIRRLSPDDEVSVVLMLTLVLTSLAIFLPWLQSLGLLVAAYLGASFGTYALFTGARFFLPLEHAVAAATSIGLLLNVTYRFLVERHAARRRAALLGSNE